MSKPKYLLMNILGEAFPVLRTQVKPKDGDTELHYYYCFRDAGSNVTRYGVKVEAAGTSLPTQVDIDGVVISLERGLTTASYKETVVVNGKKVTQEVTVPEEKRRAEVRTQQFQIFPSLVDESAGDTGLRNVKVVISETTTDGVWNVTVVVNRSGLNSVSPEKKAENVRKAAAGRRASFAAILADLHA